MTPAARPVDVGPPKRQAVLAVLALEHNRVVPTDELIGQVWGEDPPAQVRTALHGHVSRLRRMMPAPARLHRQGGGYVLETDEWSVDASRFAALTATAQQGPDGEAVDLLREALALWRGPALAGAATTRAIEAVAVRLAESRLRALEQLAERLLQLDRAAEAVPLLLRANDTEPLREGLALLTIRALCSAGDRAGALNVYHRIRRALADELGVDPSGDLQREYAALLVQPDRVDLRDRCPARAVAVPAQLPADAGYLIGRDAELTSLAEYAARKPRPAAVVINGTAGVGKTALAVRYARRNAGDYPDGQLFADLRGYDDGEPASAASVLGGFLQALGTPSADIPGGLDERTALYRSVLAGRRMLVLLDNARSVDQVRPLLAGAPGCLTLVTSRSRLDELVVRSGAVTLNVDVLAPDKALGMIAHAVGTRRVLAEPAAARTLVTLCDRLPLALQIAGARLAAHPEWTIGSLVGELGDERRRLATLATAGITIDASLSLSLRALPAPVQRAFRLLGVHPGPTIDPFAAAALLGEPYATTRRLLEALATAHLIRETAPGRYSRHDLVRLYGHQLVHDDPERGLATRRLLDYYLHTSGVARLSMEPHPPLCDGPVEYPPPVTPPITRQAAILSWTDAEEGNIFALVGLAAAAGEDARAWRLVYRVGPLYYRRGNQNRWLEILEIGLPSALRVGDKAAERLLRGHLGLALMALREFDRARAQLDRALVLAHELTDPVGVSTLLNNLGWCHFSVGDGVEARRWMERAATMARADGDAYLEAKWVSNLSRVAIFGGDLDEAERHVEHAERLVGKLPPNDAHVMVMGGRGLLLQALHRPREALLEHRRALLLARRLGDRRAESDQLHHIARALTVLYGATVAAPFVEESVSSHAQLGIALPPEALPAAVGAAAARDQPSRGTAGAQATDRGVGPP